MDELFKASFPALSDVAAKQTSIADEAYNCIAWAFEDNQRFWWPSKRTFWPLNHRGRTTKQAFDDWLTHDGWSVTLDSHYLSGTRKIALYELGGVPTLAARLLPNGVWTSKLGKSLDLVHTLQELEGPLYGVVASVYAKSADFGV